MQLFMTDCVQAHDSILEVLRHIILYLSRRPQNTCRTGDTGVGFLKLRISQNSVFKTKKFSKNRPKIIEKNSVWLRPAPTPYGSAPLPPTKVGAKCLTAVVLDNPDRALCYWGAENKTTRRNNNMDVPDRQDLQEAKLRGHTSSTKIAQYFRIHYAPDVGLRIMICTCVQLCHRNITTSPHTCIYLSLKGFSLFGRLGKNDEKDSGPPKQIFGVYLCPCM